jgi:hypothetical protein
MAVSANYDPRQPQNRKLGPVSVVGDQLVAYTSFAPSPRGQADNAPKSEQLIDAVLEGKSPSAIIEEIIDVTSR